MFPLILEDLAKGSQAGKAVTNLSRENALLKMRRSADSSIIVGLRTSGSIQDRRVETLIDSSARGWQMAEYWKKRYKKASTERWLFRLGAGLIIYDKVHGF